ncbi:Vacuolar protease A [Rhizophlyctis rosea]|uniref:Vacuolar protease A n=1 Tax=Rhizophlyctis rosea TaxID=64517 RepID=A0AAD5SJT6_9FUNG|nr:Vacuolar protease A [Rhizophlyctis rosea]
MPSATSFAVGLYAVLTIPAISHAAWYDQDNHYQNNPYQPGNGRQHAAAAAGQGGYYYRVPVEKRPAAWADVHQQMRAENQYVRYKYSHHPSFQARPNTYAEPSYPSYYQQQQQQPPAYGPPQQQYQARPVDYSYQQQQYQVPVYTPTATHKYEAATPLYTPAPAAEQYNATPIYTTPVYKPTATPYGYKETAKAKGLLKVDAGSNPYEFTADISFGTPAQKFKVRVDSGTSVSWIRGAQKKEYGYGYEQSVEVEGFDSSKSSTWHEDGEPYTLTYSNGLTVEGTLNWDMLEFGGLAVKSMFLLADSNVRVPTSEGPLCGVFGLAPQPANFGKSKDSWLYAAAKAGKCVPTFSFIPPPSASSSNSTSSYGYQAKGKNAELEVCGTSLDLPEQGMSVTEAGRQSGIWSIKFKGLKYGDAVIPLHKSSSSSYQAPSYQTPSYQTPSYQTPSYRTLSYQKPSYQTPTYQTPSYDSYATPAPYQTPGYGKSGFNRFGKREYTYQQPEPEVEAIIDTGSTFIILPRIAVEKLHKLMGAQCQVAEEQKYYKRDSDSTGGNGGKRHGMATPPAEAGLCSVSCDTSKLKDVEFEFETGKYSLKASEWVVRDPEVDGRCWSPFATFGGEEEVESGYGYKSKRDGYEKEEKVDDVVAVLGTVFTQSFATVFQIGYEDMGLTAPPASTEYGVYRRNSRFIKRQRLSTAAWSSRGSIRFLRISNAQF